MVTGFGFKNLDSFFLAIFNLTFSFTFSTLTGAAMFKTGKKLTQKMWNPIDHTTA